MGAVPTSWMVRPPVDKPVSKEKPKGSTDGLRRTLPYDQPYTNAGVEG